MNLLLGFILILLSPAVLLYYALPLLFKTAIGHSRTR
jgi:hypothetical protein